MNKKYNCSGPQAFKSQRVGYQSDTKIIASLSAFKKSAQIKGHDPFWPCPPKNYWINFCFPEFVPASRNSPMTRLATLIFDLVHTKNIWSAFNFCEYVLTFKNEFIPSVHSSDTGKFRVSSPDWPKPSLTMLSLKIFNHLLVCMNFYQHAKNQLISSVQF